MINDLLIYAHLPVTVAPGAQNNPDFQIVQDTMTVVNRTSTAPTVVQGVYDVLRCSVLQGGYGGSGQSNQNLAADAALFLPTLPASEAIPDFFTLPPYQRVTFAYENVGGRDPVGPLQTAYIGHYPRAGGVAFDLGRPYLYLTNPIAVLPGQTVVDYIHIQPSDDFLVHQFYARCLPLTVTVTIRDVASGRNFTNESVYADLIAYRNLSESQNFRQPFMPWIAPRDHRYRIEFTNHDSGELAQTVQFGFAGRLATLK